MSVPLYDLQAIRQKFGIVGKGVHIPSAKEVEEIQRKQFSSPTAILAGKGQVAAPPPTVAMDDSKTKVFNLRDASQVKGSGSLFFYRPGQGLSTKVGAVTFDLILEEEAELVATVCQHPVQSGQPITDHVQVGLPSGRLKVLVTNHSLRYAHGGAKEGNVAGMYPNNRAMDAYQTFKTIFAKREACTLVTVLDVYTDVVITHVGVPRDASSGDALVFDITFQQIRRVELKKVLLNAAVHPKDMRSANNQQAATNLDKGPQVPDTATYDTESDVVEYGGALS